MPRNRTDLLTPTEMPIISRDDIFTPPANHSSTLEKGRSAARFVARAGQMTIASAAARAARSLSASMGRSSASCAASATGALRSTSATRPSPNHCCAPGPRSTSRTSSVACRPMRCAGPSRSTRTSADAAARVSFTPRRRALLLDVSEPHVTDARDPCQRVARKGTFEQGRRSTVSTA